MVPFGDSLQWKKNLTLQALIVVYMKKKDSFLLIKKVVNGYVCGLCMIYVTVLKNCSKH